MNKITIICHTTVAKLLLVSLRSGQEITVELFHTIMKVFAN